MVKRETMDLATIVADALKRLPASTAATGTLVVPVVGVIASAIALHEPLGMREIGALALTLASVLLAVRS